LQTEDIKNLLIPIPPPEIQSAIVAKMDAAYASKRAKEAEAQRLLDSIDDYLLGELGIELPEQEENTIQSRIFTRRFSEISGGRLDPDFHAPYYKYFEEFLYKSKFEIKKLSEISSRIFQGVGRKLTDNQEYTLLKVKNILKNNVIDLSDTDLLIWMIRIRY
jgi:type I restriction enzyme M protein